MSNEEFENYLALVTRLLRLNRSQREMIRSEMRDHLESRVEEMVDSGVDRKDAVRSALEEFGDAAGLANQFQIISNINQRRWMMRFATFSIIGTFVAAIFVMAMWPGEARFGAPSTSIAQDDPFTGNPIRDAKPEPKPTQAANEKTDWDKRIRDSLQQEWSPDFEETPFVEVMEQLEEEFKINILLSDSAREDSLIEDTLVSFEVKGVQLGKCLNLMLKAYNASYVVKNDVLSIISLDVAYDPENFRTEIVDCRDLLKLIAANEQYYTGNPISIIPISEAAKHAVGVSGGTGFIRRGGGGGVFNIVVSAQDEQELSKKVEEANKKHLAIATGEAVAEKPKRFMDGHYIIKYRTAGANLIDIVKTTVDPESWDDTNGDGTIQMVGGCLVISQTEQVITDIHSLLENLKKQLAPR